MKETEGFVASRYQRPRGPGKPPDLAFIAVAWLRGVVVVG
jgi:hypothetical protein